MFTEEWLVIYLMGSFASASLRKNPMSRFDGLLNTIVAASSENEARWGGADEIVKRAIEYTNIILKDDASLYGDARDGLGRMLEILTRNSEENSAILKLREYIDELGRRFPN